MAISALATQTKLSVRNWQRARKNGSALYVGNAHPASEHPEYTASSESWAFIRIRHGACSTSGHSPTRRSSK